MSVIKTSGQDSELLAKLKLLVRQSSISRLKTQSLMDDFTLVGSPFPERDVLAHWMALILVSGSFLRITFKVHFMSDHMRKIAAKIYKKDNFELSLEQYSDFAKEYCNVTAGHVKQVLQKNNLQVGLSLPLITRGFDEIFFPENPGVVHDVWRLKNEESYIDCSAMIEVFDREIMGKLQVLEISQEEEQEIEFL